ncbi:MAG: carbonic anhydrase [Arcobacteraceae bacterium]|jgi:carbonic anhydrase|nr:carbonic anhydrase [Arcobacteraceae bacterium]
MGKIEELIKGHKEFHNLHFKKFEFQFDELVEKGQSPEILFIGCSDSRVVPDLITGSKPGDLFILRNIGNFVPPFKKDNDYHGTAAAIEYAVSVLEVKHIIVCGHSHCGACESLYKDLPQNDDLVHVRKWLELGNISKRFVEENFVGYEFSEKLRITEQISIIFQLENLLTYPAVKRRVEEETLIIHGWYYELQSGNIKYFNTETLEFEELTQQKQ